MVCALIVPEPIVGDHIGAPGHQRLRGEEIVRRFGAAQSGDAEKWRHGFCIADRAIDRSDAVVDLVFNPLQRQSLESERMVLAVGADGMPLIVDTPDYGRISMRHLADEKIGGFHALRRQRIENEVGIGRQRAVVESDHHLMVVERQRLLVLHAADLAEFARADGEDAASAERVRIARARIR